MPRTRTSLLSMKALLVNTIRLPSHDLSEKRQTSTARARDRSKGLADVVSREFLLQQEMVTLGKKRQKLSADDFSRLSPIEKTSVKQIARFVFRLLIASLLQKQRHNRGYKEGLKRITLVFELESEKRIRLEKPRPAQVAWKRSSPGADTNGTLSHSSLRS